MNIAVILSAGSGKRFESEVPKQLLDLNGSQIISYSLNKFQNTDFIDSIILVSNKDYLEETKLLASSFSKVVDVIVGGERRQDSVFNALSWIKEHGVCKKVFIHDAARPLFTNELLVSLKLASENNEAVIPVIPLEDTVKRIKDGVVESTIDRKNIVRVQTPQVFDFAKLYDCYIEFPNKLNATDDAFIIEYFGEEVKIIDGEKNNIKVTYPDDIRLAEYILK